MGAASAPAEGIHRRWDAGFRITACASTQDQAAFVLSMPRWHAFDETQETLRTSAFPSAHVKASRWPGSPDAHWSCDCERAVIGGPLRARAGEVGEEPLHRRRRVRPHRQLSCGDPPLAAYLGSFSASLCAPSSLVPHDMLGKPLKAQSPRSGDARASHPSKRVLANATMLK